MGSITPKAFRDFLGPKPERKLVLLAAIELYREGILYKLRKRDVPINYTREEAEAGAILLMI